MWRLPLLCLAAAVVLCCGSAAAAEPEEGMEKRTAEGGGEGTAGKPPEQDAGPPLSFTDEDLKKYRRPSPQSAEEDAAVLAGVEDKGEGTRPPAPKGAPLVRTPLEIARPPADDPLKEYKDREARDKFRAQQIETLRERISTLETRLAYLQQKRLAIIDPLRIMPQPQTPDEGARDAGLGAGELLASVEEEIESNEVGLKSAQENLVAIQTRFGAGAR